jgi:hypothetical protein
MPLFFAFIFLMFNRHIVIHHSFIHLHTFTAVSSVGGTSVTGGGAEPRFELEPASQQASAHDQLSHGAP